MRALVLALAALLSLSVLGCSSGGGGGEGRKDATAADAATPGQSPRMGDDRLVRTSDLTPQELQAFNVAWRHFVGHSAVWPIYRDEWLARGGAAPYVLSENLFRYFWSAAIVGKKKEIERVAETAEVIGEPAVAYFAKTLVTDRWPLAKPITTEVMDPNNLNKRIKRTFHYFEMDDTTRHYAARVLAAIGPPAVPTLASGDVLMNSRPTSRRYAAYALGRIKSPEAVDALLTMLRTSDNWQDRAAAATALVEAAETENRVKQALLTAADTDRDKFVRRKANRALAGADRITFY